MEKYVLAICLLLCVACRDARPHLPKEGRWHAQLNVMDGRKLPFIFSLDRTAQGCQVRIFNAGEVIVVDSVRIEADSIIIAMPVFEGYVAAVFNDTLMEGSFIKESLNRKVPFRASHGDVPRFKAGRKATVNVSGAWETLFRSEGEEAYPAQGLFEQAGNKVTGTFRTGKGDYRYLEGVVSGDSLLLSTFDGAHAYLFCARLKDSVLQGAFYSGNHSKEFFSARRNAAFSMPDETGLTALRDGAGAFDFSFPDTRGNTVSLSDGRFEGKVVLVQLMGTWCPNCLDETRFLVPFYERHKDRGLEIVALAFEYARTPEKAFAGIERLVRREEVAYPVLLAQYGSSNKVLAHQKLPMLDRVISYPTTIFIDRTGNVRRIYTGFNGPATGDAYEAFKTDIEDFVNMLLAE